LSVTKEKLSSYITKRILPWFKKNGWTAFPFQQKAWQKYADGYSGIVNAPTGSGKTYSLLLPIILEAQYNQEQTGKKSKGLQVIWITPIRALSKEIEQSAKRALLALGSDWEVQTRTGDTSAKVKNQQKLKLPEILITTPESLHILLAQKNGKPRFRNLKVVVADEWHELIGTKRAVLLELALSRLRGMNPALRTWGISATIGNMEEAQEFLLGETRNTQSTERIVANIRKKLEVVSIMPDDVKELPWAGHLGIKLLEKVIPVIEKSKTTLIFTNTRSQAEIWYQRILEVAPHLAGIMAMHHSSISKDIRGWVEDALYDGRLKAVVCTSSLDLGVDFRPVETIIQIGSPKGVARFMQRAGRSGHQPGATSRIYFVPTHSLELIEAASLRAAIDQKVVESRLPYIRSFDVLLQYMVTLAVADGFNQEELYKEITQTRSFDSVTIEEWHWCLHFLVNGGNQLSGYDEFHKVVLEEGLYKVLDRKIAMRHRMSIGTITSDQMLQVRMSRGGYLGTIEEYFASRLQAREVSWFAGQNLQFIKMKGMVVEVQRTNKTKGLVPSYNGGRIPLSAELGAMLRIQMGQSLTNQNSPELKMIAPLMELQNEQSMVPNNEVLLIESLHSNEGHHLFIYPFEGRLVHEGLSALLAYRLSLFQPISFSIAMNDYGFELLSDEEIPIQDAVDSDIFSEDDLMEDIISSINETEMSKRRFRDIARISGLTFAGYPGKLVKDKHLQANSSLFFQVFSDYEPNNLLLKQTHEEVREFQLEEARTRDALSRINKQEIRIVEIQKPTPLAFPIMVDRTREKLSSESLAERIKKMLA